MQVERQSGGNSVSSAAKGCVKCGQRTPGTRISRRKAVQYLMRPQGGISPRSKGEDPQGLVGLGAAHIPSACWWGNGLPRQRRIAGLRGRPATLGLRHCPNSYGRLQGRIFRNGRKSDGATPRVGRSSSGCKPPSGITKQVRPIGAHVEESQRKPRLTSCQQPR